MRCQEPGLPPLFEVRVAVHGVDQRAAHAPGGRLPRSPGRTLLLELPQLAMGQLVWPCPPERLNAEDRNARQGVPPIY